MSIDAAGSICPKTREEWRAWLERHHHDTDSIWIVYHKKGSGVPRVSWKDAVEEALCFGWIDGRARPIDAETYKQFFCKRKPGGTWSKINKESVARLTAQGLMTEAGIAAVETAKQNGSWTILDEVEDLRVPEDLAAALDARTGARARFDALSRSSKRLALHWLLTAKRPETRLKRIAGIVASAAAGKQVGGL